MRRKGLFLLLAALLVGALPVASLADSITPTSVSATLGVGDTVTITKSVTVNAGTPTTSKVDVFFLADTTGSMGGAIASVKASAGAILSGAAGLGDVAFGVGEYKDTPYGGWTDPYVYRLNQAISTSQSAAQTGINAWGAYGGGDYPESDLYALKQVAEGAGWRAGSTRILVWFGDAPGHDPGGPAPGVTEATATASLLAGGINVQAIDVGSLDAYGQATRIAAATGGAFYDGIDSSSIVATIQAAITSVFASYSNVGLDLSELPAGLGASLIPAYYTGTFDRSVERTFTFDLALTGTAPGTYDFNIYGTVNGGRVATESDHIVVRGAAVPEPGSMLLLGSGLIGLAGLRRRIAG